MRVTLIITTYNWPQALKLVLRRVRGQRRLPDEVVIADDGSGPDTATLVHQEALDFPVPIVHSWQEDKGYRLARSRNLGIARATGDYIVMIDGDMVLEKHFVEDHLAAARKNFYVQGGRVLLPRELTNDLIAGREDKVNLLARGLGNRKNVLRLRLLSRLFSARGRNYEATRGCNLAFWRDDALAVNGFNEDFVSWGREDSEFAVRMLNLGLRRLTLKFAASAFHLYHDEQSRSALPRNDQLLEQAIQKQKIRCEHGVVSHLKI